MNENYIVKMIYKGKKITRTITRHWSNSFEFTMNCLYPDAKILEYRKV